MVYKKTWSDFHIKKQTQLFNYLIKTFKNLDIDTFIDVKKKDLLKIIEANLLENLPQIDASPEMNKIYSQYFNFLKNMKMSMARELTVQELRDVKSYFYSMVYDTLE